MVGLTCSLPTGLLIALPLISHGPAVQDQESVDCSPGTMVVELAVKKEQEVCGQELFDGGFALQALHAVPLVLHVSVPTLICPQEFGCDEQGCVAPGAHPAPPPVTVTVVAAAAALVPFSIMTSGESVPIWG